MNKKGKILLFVIASLIVVIISCLVLLKTTNSTSTSIKVDLASLTYEENEVKDSLKIYTQDEFSEFLSDYNNGKLNNVYITHFLFDGVSMYAPYDLDDFVEDGNDTKVDPLDIMVLNINTKGDIELSGEMEGMIAVNTNDIKGKINLLLNGVSIDTNSKKVPAIYVYNTDITSTDAKVTIVPVKDTKNYIEGGKLKKVSLIPSEKLNDYSNKYSGENKTNYNEYTNYYGVYTSDEIKNILFATVKADNEDLSDGDPYYFYKASGAISSDIDLYFEGSGYLEVTSKNKEGIETKGNLSFNGGVGDYVVTSQDDCLNTTTDDAEISNARNNLTIDVNSLYAIVDSEADEGDAIDSNGTLIINGGLVVAVAKTGQDAGIDSSKGTYINGGEVISTGDMYDEVNSSSKQNFMVLSFSERVNIGDTVVLKDSSDKVLFAYKSDRTYTSLVYSSKDLVDGTYYLYKNGSIEGEEIKGFYTEINSYQNGDQLGYSSKGNMGGNPEGNMMNQGDRPEPPSGDMMNQGDRPELPSEDMMSQNNEDREQPSRGEMTFENNTSATNSDFIIEGVSNLFSGVALLK